MQSLMQAQRHGLSDQVTVTAGLSTLINNTITNDTPHILTTQQRTTYGLMTHLTPHTHVAGSGISNGDSAGGSSDNGGGSSSPDDGGAGGDGDGDNTGGGEDDDAGEGGVFGPHNDYASIVCDSRHGKGDRHTGTISICDRNGVSEQGLRCSFVKKERVTASSTGGIFRCN